MRSIPRTPSRVSGSLLAATDAGSLGSISRTPCQPRLKPIDFPAAIVGIERDRANARVEPGHIAAAGQDSDLQFAPAVAVLTG